MTWALEGKSVTAGWLGIGQKRLEGFDAVNHHQALWSRNRDPWRRSVKPCVGFNFSSFRSLPSFAQKVSYDELSVEVANDQRTHLRPMTFTAEKRLMRRRPRQRLSRTHLFGASERTDRLPHLSPCLRAADTSKLCCPSGDCRAVT
ncbi:hypothetical protein AAFF_G00179180 [Aldrovandia affinis]|uniref:Uncharacterized protein n=1 Tax=Aldrovandia affinis TaxID=143900 RepID=A0AAD7VX43_9TELE|nr:hypothetical protein AAFF_G00179180 [Aldrovandia affinis]